MEIPRKGPESVVETLFSVVRVLRVPTKTVRMTTKTSKSVPRLSCDSIYEGDHVIIGLDTVRKYGKSELLYVFRLTTTKKTKS